MNAISVKLLFLLVTITAPALLSGQSTLRLVSKANVENEGTPLTEGPEYEMASEIYRRLVEARGDRRFKEPVFTMDMGERSVAFFVGADHRIALEKKAYDICMSLGKETGKNAIAALLGHELIHFYEKHQWRSGFAQTNADLTIGARLQRIAGADRLSNETQADYLGGFLAYSAGYDVYEALPKLFDELYAKYPLKDEEMEDNYPSKEDRKAMARKAMEKLNRLVEVFDMANLMTAVGRYNDARAFYKHILIDYQGREIYNNLGVLTVLQAMTYLTEKERRYRLPLELDLNFGSSTRSGAGDSEKIKNALLREAVVYFNNAISLDPDYAPAYLNKACAFFLLEQDDLTRARFYAGVEAKQRAAANARFEKTAWDADVLLALIALAEGKEADARQLLETARKKTTVADYNFRVLTGQPLKKPSKPNGPEYEVINDLEIDDIRTEIRNLTRSNRDEIREEVLFEQLRFRVYENMGKLKNSRIYHCDPPFGDDSPDVYFHLTNADYPGEVYDGIKVGTPLSTITDQYGEPKFAYEATNGAIIGYEQMLFFLDQEKRVKRWAHYYLQ